MGRAAGYTGTAGGTEMYGFRIMAEKAVESTTLEENGGPVSGTVDIGKPDDFIDRRFLHDAVSSDPGHGHHPEHPYRRG